MKKPKVLFGKIFVLVLLFVLCGCGGNDATNEINVGCSPAELIDAINQANSDANTNTLNLTTDCEYILDVPDNEWVLAGMSMGDNGLPVITSQLTINGNNARIRRDILAPEFRIFLIAVSGNLTLNNVSVENGSVPSYQGGAIYNYGTLHLNDSTVRDNHARSGGGITNVELATLVINFTKFINNTALEYGGAISSFGELFIWEDSLFEENSSGLAGGAIDNGCSGFTARQVSFVGNHSDTAGGAFSCRCGAESGIITFSDVTFNDNDATYGGAISTLADCTIEVAASTFTLNRATDMGGAISNHGTTTVRLGTEFATNTAGSDGGAIYNYLGNFTSQDDSIYRDSIAGRDGGAIYSTGNITINTNTFERNQAVNSGGAIYCNNYQQNNQFTLTTIDGATLRHNHADQGGAFYAASDCEFNITGSTFQQNLRFSSPINEGGAIYNRGFGDIKESTIKGNEAVSGGGIYNQGENLAIYQTTLNDNEAFGEGGAIWSLGFGFRLNNSTVDDNIADRVGGVYIGNESGFIEFSTLTNNTNSTQNLGSNHFHGGQTLIKGSIFAYNDIDCSISAGATVNLSDENLQLNGTCQGFTMAVDPELEALTDNGGATFTRAPRAGSPVIDRTYDCSTKQPPTSVDQRGVQRPQGGLCDIGAVEVEAPGLQPMPPSTPPPTQPPFACVELLGVTVRGDGTIRIQLETQDLPEGEYEAQVGKYDFTCKTYRDYPDRLFCDGPKGKGGTLVTLTIFDANGKTICQEDFTIPAPEQPETKEPSEGVDCTEKYGDNYSSCVLDPACKWSDPDYMCYNK